MSASSIAASLRSSLALRLASRLGALALLASACVLAARLAGQSSQPTRASAQRPAEPDASFAVPERLSVDGLAGFSARSELRYASAPDDLHLLDVHAMFPQRVRWQIARPDARAHSTDWRLGRRIFHQDAASEAPALELHGAAWRALARRFELRNAVLMHPALHAWEEVVAHGSTHQRRAALFAPPAPGEEQGAPMGELVAELDAVDRLIAMSVRDESGALQERLLVLERASHGGREWPSKLELHTEAGLVWTENVLSVQTRVGFLERFFAPSSALQDPGAAKPPATSQPSKP